MRSITRYRFMDPDEGQRYFIAMPADARILFVSMQDGFGAMWYEAGSDKIIERRFVLVGTGRPLEDNLTHIGAWVNGPETWHVLEEKADAPRAV